ncbi:MAG: DrmE family protein [Patescibacteria group bacterium]|nr:DrmE family protein [Patescibacteria group bacterium]
MFNQRILDNIKESIPYLQKLNIKVSGTAFLMTDYEKINALLIKNNVLDENHNNIAIFHPINDLLDIYILVIMGLAAYEYAILNNSKSKLEDFRVGELVEYGGRVVQYQGITLCNDNIEKFELKYDDEYKTTELLPLSYSNKISKYSGCKTTADKYNSKISNKNVGDILHTVIDYKDGEITLSGYPPFLVVSERPALIELLKKITINGIPFFEFFPSVKCTSCNRQRIGRNIAQRSYMFYFAASLSTADDVLRSENGIKTLFVDAHGKSLDDGNLLAALKNQYGIEDVYWLQNYSKLDAMENLESGLGFKIWIWKTDDFEELAINKQSNGLVMTHNNGNDENNCLVDMHKQSLRRLAAYKDNLVEIEYPAGLIADFHVDIQKQLKNMFFDAGEYGNRELRFFCINAASIYNRIFQSPLPISQINKIASSYGKKTVNEDFQNLENLPSRLTGAVPLNFDANAHKLLSDFKYVLNAYEAYSGKLKSISSIISHSPGKSTCVLIKYSYMVDEVKESVLRDLVNGGNGHLCKNVFFSDNVSDINSIYDQLIWTYKPQIAASPMIAPMVETNYILLYPQQKKELEQTLQINKRRLNRYADAEYRSGILKVSKDILGHVTEKNNFDSSSADLFDLDELLTSVFSKTVTGTHTDGQEDAVDAKMVVFSGGNYAFFQAGNKIKVLDSEQKSIDVKNVESLNEGDEIVFLNDSKRTVFDELVEYYEHKPEIVKMVKTSELWRNALIEFCNERQLSPDELKIILDNDGLVRHQITINGWLNGTTICPDEDNYSPVDIIANITGNVLLRNNLNEVKTAAKQMHALRIKIGKYLANKITQSFASPESIIDDPVLRNKLDEISSHVRLGTVSQISNDYKKVPLEITNKMVSIEDMKEL